MTEIHKRWDSDMFVGRISSVLSGFVSVPNLKSNLKVLKRVKVGAESLSKAFAA